MRKRRFNDIEEAESAAGIRAWIAVLALSAAGAALKLSGTVDWSWWAVLLPLWLMPAVWAVIVITYSIAILLLVLWFALRLSADLAGRLLGKLSLLSGKTDR